MNATTEQSAGTENQQPADVEQPQAEPQHEEQAAPDRDRWAEVKECFDATLDTTCELGANSALLAMHTTQLTLTGLNAGVVVLDYAAVEAIKATKDFDAKSFIDDLFKEEEVAK
jgi:hypothetical protein